VPLDGPRERPPLVAEELAPEELAAQRAAVHSLEARSPPRAQPVERRRHQLLPGARLAHDQDRHVDGREAREAPEEGLHGWTLADQALEPRQGSRGRPRGGHRSRLARGFQMSGDSGFPWGGVGRQATVPSSRARKATPGPETGEVAPCSSPSRSRPSRERSAN
jgi:hypothetical protein